MTNDPRSPHPPDGDAGEKLLDAAVSAARTTPSTERFAASRDNLRVALRAAGLALEEQDCEAFRRDLPGLVASTLAADRADLVADHCRECLPCRKALLALREGPVASPAPRPAAARRYPRLGRVLAPLAGLAAGIGAVTLVASLLRPAPSPLMSRLVSVDGQILDDEGSVLAPGALIPTGHPVRTARASRAVIELPDGSRLEMNERASLRVAGEGSSLTVDLDRGDVIVEAAKRKQRDLFVHTPDCTVAVKGTVFTVRRGLKGSRVGVLEGSVHVEQDGQVTALAPGEQVATDPALSPEALDEQVAWSVDRERYSALLDVIQSAAAQLEQEGFETSPRHESSILDAMPESAVLYAAMPNDGEMARLAELIGQRVATNPRLSKWWDAQLREDSAQPNFAILLDTVQRLSASLGDEVVLALVDEGAEPMPVLIASVRDEGGLRSLIEDLSARAGKEPPVLLSGETLGTLGRDGELNLLLHAGHVLVGPKPEALAQFVAGFDEPRPRSSRFLASLDGQYDRGAEYLVAADLSRLVAGAVRADAQASGAGWVDRSMNVLGLGAADQFVLTAGHDDPGTAVLSFNEKRTGLASWLAEPSPMGALSFVTPQAGIVFAAACREPKGMLLDLERISGSDANGAFAQFRERTGVDLVDDIAGTLGGEMTLALDGPILPKPSWKLVLEVYDEARLQDTLEHLVEEVASRPHENGVATIAPALSPIETSEGSAWQLDLGAVRIAYAYRDGYLVACPAVPLLEAALQAQRLDVNLPQSPVFRNLLPGGVEPDVSLLLYQDLASKVGELQQATNALPAGVRETLGGTGPSLAYARAADTSISFGLMAPENGLGRGLANFVRQRALQALAAESLAQASQGALGEQH